MTGTATASRTWPPTGPGAGVWRYRAWLPVARPEAAVTLGEGGTPLLGAGPLADGGRLLLKNEAANPTLAFKDRPVSVAATVAREQRATGLLCASTGNTAASVAAYGARAGLPVVCLVPAGTPAGKLRMAGAVGARVLEVAGTFSDAHALAVSLAEETGWANLTSTYVNPAMLEGDKTLGLELVEQLGGEAPDAVLVPVGAGPLLAGIGMAFDELRAAGALTRGPRLFAVQATGCAPIARAFTEGGRVRAWTDPAATAAGAIADPLIGYAEDGDRTLAAVRASGGAALAVDDAELAAAVRDLARHTGLLVELAAAAGVAAYRRLRADGRLGADDVAVAVLTGHGAKDAAGAGGAHVVGTVAPDGLDDARRLLGTLADG